MPEMTREAFLRLLAQQQGLTPERFGVAAIGQMAANEGPLQPSEPEIPPGIVPLVPKDMVLTGIARPIGVSPRGLPNYYSIGSNSFQPIPGRVLLAIKKLAGGAIKGVGEERVLFDDAAMTKAGVPVFGARIEFRVNPDGKTKPGCQFGFINYVERTTKWSAKNDGKETSAGELDNLEGDPLPDKYKVVKRIDGPTSKTDPKYFNQKCETETDNNGNVKPVCWKGDDPAVDQKTLTDAANRAFAAAKGFPDEVCITVIWNLWAVFCEICPGQTTAMSTSHVTVSVSQCFKMNSRTKRMAATAGPKLDPDPPKADGGAPATAADQKELEELLKQPWGPVPAK